MLDRGDLGHLDPEEDRQIIQSVTIGGGGLYGTPTYWNGPDGPHIYVWPTGDVGKMYKLQEQRLSPVPVFETKDPVKKPGGIIAISANGAVAGSGLLWAITGDYDAGSRSVPGVLRAFDASDVGKEI